MPFNPGFTLPNTLRLPEEESIGAMSIPAEPDNICLGLNYNFKSLVAHLRKDRLDIFDSTDAERRTFFKLPSASRIIFFDWIRRN
jgi:hypothetical protein